MLKGLNKLKICYVYKHNMFRTLRSNGQKLGFYDTTTNPIINNFGGGGSGGGGDEDPKLFHIILLVFTIYTVNKLLK